MQFILALFGAVFAVFVCLVFLVLWAISVYVTGRQRKKQFVPPYTEPSLSRCAANDRHVITYSPADLTRSVPYAHAEHHAIDDTQLRDVDTPRNRISRYEAEEILRSEMRRHHIR